MGNDERRGLEQRGKTWQDMEAKKIKEGWSRQFRCQGAGRQDGRWLGPNTSRKVLPARRRRHGDAQQQGSCCTSLSLLDNPPTAPSWRPEKGRVLAFGNIPKSRPCYQRISRPNASWIRSPHATRGVVGRGARKQKSADLVARSEATKLSKAGTSQATSRRPILP